MSRTPAGIIPDTTWDTQVALKYERASILLEELSKTGIVSHALKAAGLTRSQVDAMLRSDKVFRNAWEQATFRAADVLRAEARRRAVEGVRKPLYHQGQPIYLYRTVLGEDGQPLKDEAGREVREVLRDENGQPVQAVEVNYSDTLLLACLKAVDPAFRDKSSVEMSGPGGGPIEQKTVTDLDAARRIAYALQRGALAAKATPQNTSDAQYPDELDDPGGDLI